MRHEGWLFDIYPSEKGMVIWLKTKNGNSLKFIDDYRPILYVHGSPSNLRELKRELASNEMVYEISYVEKILRLRDFKKTKVVKINAASIHGFHRLADNIVRSGGYNKYSLFNVDIPHARAYLYDRDLFPLAKVSLGDSLKLSFDLLDSIASIDYELPPMKSIWLSVKHHIKGILPSFEDVIDSISISHYGEEYLFDEGDEVEKLLNLIDFMRKEDPDLIFVRDGDSWTIPYLVKRAQKNVISKEMILGREPGQIRMGIRTGSSYFSYGRVCYGSSTQHLLGRVHIDVGNSFIYGKCGLEGLIELSRVTRVPLQETAGSSIGGVMSSIQLYTAAGNGVLIPWMKREPEEFKTAWKLLEADRGGFIFEPRVGIHERVGEIDFSSFYPTMMEKYNISPETVLCDCCPNSSTKVPELGYNICERRKGIIPEVLETVLNKRREYKRRMVEARNPKIKEINNRRQSALKWILVTCFGYLGYRNARFGRIESHESVTAFARHNLLKAASIAEDNGFEVIHGIVDSLWVKKPDASRSEFVSLCTEVEKKTGLPIHLEGIYNWIVFLPSKTRASLPVINRFYGAFENGRLKVRGLMVRRRDTPELVKRAQMEMLDKVAKAIHVGDFKSRIPEALGMSAKYAKYLMDGRAGANELAIYRQLSRHPLVYEVRAHTAIAAMQMLEAGVNLQPGQTVAYIVANSRAKNPNLRVTALPMIKKSSYDKRWYLELLLGAVEELFSSFGHTRERMEAEKIDSTRQTKL